eukprot:1147422-Pelagomonas_calceolata.AAC.3
MVRGKERTAMKQAQSCITFGIRPSEKAEWTGQRYRSDKARLPGDLAHELSLQEHAGLVAACLATSTRCCRCKEWHNACYGPL